MWSVVLAVTAVAVLAYAAWVGRAQWQAIPRDLFHFDPLPLAASWLVQTLGWLLLVANWRRILARLGAPQVEWARHGEIHAWSGLGNLVPGSVWMPASRVVLYRRAGVSSLLLSEAIVIEWLAVGLAGVVLYLVSVPFSTPAAGRTTLLVVAAGAAAVLVLHPRTLTAALAYASRRFGGAPEPARAADAWGWRTLAGLVLAETAVLAMSGLGLYCLMLAIGPEASLPDALCSWALSVAVANLLAFLPATVVLREGAMAAALAPLYGSVFVAIVVVVVWRLWMTGVLASWALAASAWRRLAA
jgi:uncharacterized membrane protein YbhN (UPF0104 family)